MNHKERFQLLLMICLWFLLAGPLQAEPQNSSSASSSSESTAAELGVSFVAGSNSEIVLEKNGKRYLINAATHSIRESAENAAAAVENPAQTSSSSAQPQTQTAAEPTQEAPKVYEPGDNMVFTLPTGRRLERHGFYIDFTHRFPYSAAFSGQARGAILGGLDDFALPSFGFRFGVTSKFSVSAFRSPSVIGRPIEFMAAYNFLDEHDGQPVNMAVRYSLDGQNNFGRNFTNNFELVMSRSVTHRAQLYLVPTLSIHDRPLLQAGVLIPPAKLPCGGPMVTANLLTAPATFTRNCANTFSLGIGAMVDVRPTVALLAETIPTLANGPELGIHRPAFSFGIKKKIWRHAFTFGFTNSPGATVAQRAGTRATFLGQPAADKPSGMFVGFDIMRQVY